MSDSKPDSPDPDKPKRKKRHAPAPSAFQKRVLWRAITGASMVVVACLAVGSVIVFGNVLGFLQPVLVPLALAGILAYLLDPVVRWARAKRFFGRDLTRIQAVLLVFFLATAAMIALAISVAIPASKQLSKLYDDKANIIAKAERTLAAVAAKIESAIGWGAEEEPEGEDETSEDDPKEAKPQPEPTPEGETVSPFDAEQSDETTTEVADAEAAGVETLDGNDELPESLLWKEFLKWLQSPETGKAVLAFFGKAMNGFFGAIGYIVGFFLVPIYLFFFLKDAASIRESWADYVPLRASELKDEVVDVLSEVNGYLIAYFRGQVLVSVIDGVITGVILTIMGLDYAVVIGVALAILGVIPFVGFIVTAVPAIIIAAAQSQANDAANPALYPLAVALAFIAVQQIDGIFIQPKIVGDSVGLHPLTVIFSVLFWSLLIGGVLGALLAVPLTAGVKVLFRRYIWEQKIRPKVLDAPPPATPAG